MFTWFFQPGTVHDWDTAAKSDTQAFGKFHRAMLEQGIYLPPSQYEAMFMSAAHSDARYTGDNYCRYRVALMRYSTCALSFDSHEFPHKLCNFIRCGVQGKMAGIENVDLGCGNVAPIRLRFSQFK